MRAHLISGGFPPGSTAGHDMDYVRLSLLQLLNERDVKTSVSSDFAELDKWLANCQLLLTYVAGPFPNDEQCAHLDSWLAAGGHWVGLHGTSGGKAVRTDDGQRRKMVKLAHHQTLGSFFLNHPPVRKFTVKIEDSGHPLMQDMPASFEAVDELYMIEMQDPNAKVLLTTELPQDRYPASALLTTKTLRCRQMARRGYWVMCAKSVKVRLLIGPSVIVIHPAPMASHLWMPVSPQMAKPP